MVVLQKVSYRNISTLYQNSVVKQPFRELHNNYVLVPVDKATGNVTIICWEFYELALIKELGLDRDTKNDTISTY